MSGEVVEPGAGERITSTAEKVAALLAGLPQDRLTVDGEQYIHLAIIRLAEECPDKWGHLPRGRAGDVVHSSPIRGALSALTLNGNLFLVQISPDDRRQYVIQREQIKSGLSDPGLLDRQMSERFLELLEELHGDDIDIEAFINV